MEKLVYIAWKRNGDAIEDFRKQLVDELGPRLPGLGARKLTINVADLEEALRSITSRLTGYLVTESVPLACPDRDWPDGERSPGLTHFTAFPKPWERRRRARLGRLASRRCRFDSTPWRCGNSPVSMEA